MVVQLKDMSALFFSAASGGVSGWGIHFALLRPGAGNDLENLLLPDLSVSNISQHAFWNDVTISDTPIFVTANFAWEGDECHYCDHRYKISSYTWKTSSLLDGPYYSLEDEYMTVRKYKSEDADILGSEKPEILARLRRGKAERERQNKAR